MKTLLFTLEYPPFNGGVANYYGNLAKYWPINEFLKILNNNNNELIIKEKLQNFLSKIFNPTSQQFFGLFLIKQLIVSSFTRC